MALRITFHARLRLDRVPFSLARLCALPAQPLQHAAPPAGRYAPGRPCSHSSREHPLHLMALGGRGAACDVRLCIPLVLQGPWFRTEAAVFLPRHVGDCNGRRWAWTSSWQQAFSDLQCTGQPRSFFGVGPVVPEAGTGQGWDRKCPFPCFPQPPHRGQLAGRALLQSDPGGWDPGAPAHHYGTGRARAEQWPEHQSRGRPGGSALQCKSGPGHGTHHEVYTLHSGCVREHHSGRGAADEQKGARQSRSQGTKEHCRSVFLEVRYGPRPLFSRETASGFGWFPTAGVNRRYLNAVADSSR